MFKIIGWVNAVLIIFMVSIYPLKLIYLKKSKTSRGEREKWKYAYTTLRKLHPRLGAIIFLFGIYHGSQAFSLTVVHTGTLLLYSVLLMGIIAIFGQRIRVFRKHWRLAHRIVDGAVLTMLAIHIFNRNLI